LDCFNLEDGADSLPRNVSTIYKTTVRNTPEERESDMILYE